MAFREKMAWGSLAATTAIWAWYFLGFVAALGGRRFDAGREIGHFMMAVAMLVAVQILIATVLALSSPREANARADDRERGFALQAYRAAFVTLNTLVATLTVAAPLVIATAPAWLDGRPAGMVPIVICNALLASLVLAELVRSGTVALLYRRGA